MQKWCVLFYVFSISGGLWAHETNSGLRHSGRTDSYGCHNQTSTNTRHCHGTTVVVPPTIPVVPVVVAPQQCTVPSDTKLQHALENSAEIEVRLANGSNTPSQVLEWVAWHEEYYPTLSITWSRLRNIAEAML